MKAMKGISSHYYFWANKNHPGVIFYRKRFDGPELKMSLVKRGKMMPLGFPTELPPAGHTSDRKDYIENKVSPLKIMAKNLTQWPMYQFCVVIAIVW